MAEEVQDNKKKAPAPKKAKPAVQAAPAAKSVPAAQPKQTPARAPKPFKPGTKKVNLYTITGTVESEVTLPAVFDSALRPDLIRKAVNAARANRRQAYGPNPRSGMRHSVETAGKGQGISRVQRLKSGRNAAESPNNVGGRRAHPPKPWAIWSEKINKKERAKARYSAMAATANMDLVISRGHMFNRKITLPVVVSDNFEKIQKTKKVIDSLDSLGVYNDVVRAKEGTHIRAGRGKMRGRRFRVPRGILIIVSEKGSLSKAARNLPGVEIRVPGEINTEVLAPGGDPGRLALITQSALKQIGGW
jgi:large subunit ribosomal protein L4e